MFFFTCIPLFVYGQISTEELPYSWTNADNIPALRSNIPPKEMSRLNLKAIEVEDEENDNIGPYRFGIEEEVDFDLTNSGNWIYTDDGGRLWTLKINSPDALSLNLVYDKFWLPEGAKFYIYSSDKKQHMGAFTSKNNIGSREDIQGFATGLLFTNEIVLEYYEPSDVEDGIISVAQVITGYRGFPSPSVQLRHNSTLYPCHIDINCEEGLNYQNEKNAVAYQVMGGALCTGALINTTADDLRPYYLTAEHCFVGKPNSQSWVFYWNYEASSCGEIAYPSQSKCTTGATLLARRETTDFTLLELIENPLDNPNVTAYFLGWDRRSNNATSGVSIHHPGGAQKKISIENNSIYNHPYTQAWADGQGNILSLTPPNTHWCVRFDKGTTEGGSSGSPLLDQNKLIIGQLHGGGNGCPPNTVKFYGRLDVSWSGNTPESRLKDWLDPINSSELYVRGKCEATYYNNRTFTSGINMLTGCEVQLKNTIVRNTNTRLNVIAKDIVIIKPGFTASEGTLVNIKIATPTLRSDIDIQNEENYYNNEEFTDVEIIPEVIQSEVITMKIYSVTGVLLYASETNFEIINAQLDNGVYVIEKVYDDGSYKREKVILKR